MTQTTHKYLVDNPAFPYCSGCGHTWINRSLGSALEKLDKKPTEINLVSDIGCVGLVDKMFLTNTIHTTHGRSTAFAAGLQLADEILFDDETVHVVMIGDGGATIGLLHLVEAAKFNINMTVILHNNFVYGMTGGQNSGLTPKDFKTSTTMGGNLVPAINISELLKAAQAGFIARKLATDRDLDDTILEAINYKGFALVEVIELCTGYATKWNKMSKDDVNEILVGMDCGQLGTILKRSDRESFAVSYKEAFKKPDLGQENKVSPKSKNIPVTGSLELESPFSVIVAGSAGEGVQFASQTLLKAAVTAGLNVVQKNDNPVTIGTGFSMSELNFSSDEIYYSGIDVPDYILISSLDGLNRIRDLIEQLNGAAGKMLIIIDQSLIGDITYKNFKIISKDFKSLIKDKKSLNFVMVGHLFKYLKNFNFKYLEEAILLIRGKNTHEILEAAKLGFNLS